MASFQFKEFSVKQDNSAMKVGTDSILLGAWTFIDDGIDKILDIGAGTGLLSLMMAQRSDAQTIDAVEIDTLAYEECINNFENSPWGDRLFCYHSSIQEFEEEFLKKYDLILANPPFFDISNIQEATSRSIARQTHLLNHITLLKISKSLLSKSGTCAFVIPFQMELFFVDLAKNMGLFPLRITRVKDTEMAVAKRSLLMLSTNNTLAQEDVLVLKNKDGSYTQSFIKLTKAFYLNF